MEIMTVISTAVLH